MSASNRFRITGGTIRGKRLHAPSTLAVRPMQGSVRESLFNILGPCIAGASLLDLFSGSGAIGLDALSRGAASCVFVENFGPSLRVLRRNIREAGLQDRCRVLVRDLLKVRRLPLTGFEPFHGIFLDPPFAFHDPKAPNVLPSLLERIQDQGSLVTTPFLVLQIRRKQVPPDPLGPFAFESRRDYGSVSLLFYTGISYK